MRLQLGCGVAVPDRGGSDRIDRRLGYRIFLVRRYLAMDVILPYVAWITLLAFAMDLGSARVASETVSVG